MQCPPQGGDQNEVHIELRESLPRDEGLLLSVLGELDIEILAAELLIEVFLGGEIVGTNLLL